MALTLPCQRDVDRMVESNTSLARRMAWKARTTCESYDDVYADALVGLWNAARRYDASREVAFRTYAGRCIAGAIADGRRERDWLTRAQRKRVPDQVPPDRMAPASLDSPVGCEGTASLIDTVVDSVDDIQEWLDEQEYVERVHLVDQLLCRLTDRECAVVEAMREGKRVMTVAAEWGVTEGRVSQIKQRAIWKLRHMVPQAAGAPGGSTT
jgi:RNA polymerase sigma factor (sigma-70 family)